MYPASFDYFRPKTLAEAAALLRKHKGLEDARRRPQPASGDEAAPLLAPRPRGPRRGQGALGNQGQRKVALQIGAMTMHADVAASSLVEKVCPILAEAAAQIGDLQVRNRGTIGGSLAHADPAADYPTVLARARAPRSSRRGPKGAAEDRRREVLHGPLHDRAEARRDPDLGPRARLRQGDGRGVPQAPPPGLELRGRRRRGDRRARRRPLPRRPPRGRRSHADPRALRRRRGGARPGRSPTPGAIEAAAEARGRRDLRSDCPTRTPPASSGRTSRRCWPNVPSRRRPSAPAAEPGRPAASAGGPFASIDALQEALRRRNYFASRGLATSLFLALKLSRPLFLEGRGRHRQDRGRQGPRATSSRPT